MRAVVFYGVGDIRSDGVPQPTIQAPADVVVRIAHSASCGTDLRLIRRTFAGTILGHEGVGVGEEVGPDVRNLRRGAGW